MRCSRLRPVAGPPGDLFPCFLVQLVQVLFDGEFFAAQRAAHGHDLSADLENYFLAACLALHKDLKFWVKTGAGKEVQKRSLLNLLSSGF
jgi:hypothetical protein